MDKYYFIVKQQVKLLMHTLNQTLKLNASTMDSQQVIPLHIKQWM